ncbi:MAG: hypothetical protein J7M14_00025 [Planctomycetes bacterium]|nr:hypothetical protein [Planctomycetota bacterium]
MTEHDNTQPPAGLECDWLRIVNYLVGRAGEIHVPLARCELRSLAGLAVAKARAYYDPAKASYPLGRWVCKQGWRLLLAEIRNELRRRRRSVAATTFTDVEAGMPQGQSLSRLLKGRDEGPPGQCSALLEGLCRSDCEIVLLRVEKWTYRQIGLELGLSGEAIRLRLVKVRRLLTRRLAR